MIQFNKVSKRYQNGHDALRDVSFHLAKGEMAFLTGHSGAGKSTLLKLVMALEPYTQGQILVANKNLAKLSRRQIPSLRQSIGIIFQNPELITSRTVFENVALPLIVAGYSHDEIGRRYRQLIHQFFVL